MYVISTLALCAPSTHLIYAQHDATKINHNALTRGSHTPSYISANPPHPSSLLASIEPHPTPLHHRALGNPTPQPHRLIPIIRPKARAPLDPARKLRLRALFQILHHRAVRAWAGAAWYGCDYIAGCGVGVAGEEAGMPGGGGEAFGGRAGGGVGTGGAGGDGEGEEGEEEVVELHGE